MASRDFLKHVVSTSEPVGSTLGDEYYNPSSNQVFKRLAVNGTSVQWVELQPGISVQANSTTVSTATRIVNFAGAGVSTTASGSTVTVTVAGSGASTPITISNKTGAYTVIASDAGTIINCTANIFTVSLTAAATLGAGFNVTIWNTSANSGHVITIDPAGSETIDGQTTLILRRGEGMQIVCDGTNWQTGNKKTMRGYAENFLDTTYIRPIASGNLSVSIGVACQSNSQFGVSIGATAQALGSNNTIAIGVGTTASSDYSAAIGQNSANQGSQAVTGNGAMALGGSYASGADSFAAAIVNNTSSYGATGANSFALGQTGRATQSNAIAFSGFQGASATGSGAVAFQSSTASGSGAVAFGNTLALVGATASGQSSFAFGPGAVAATTGKFAFSSDNYYQNATSGTSQAAKYILRNFTIDATPKVLLCDYAASASVTNQVILPSNSAYAFTGIIVARQQAAGGTQSAAWRVEGLIRREAGVATTTLVSSAVNTISNVPGWTIALTADVTNGGLAITATGAAATNLRWVATIDASEVTFT